MRVLIKNGLLIDPKNKINSEEFQYGLEEEKELQPDPELEAEKVAKESFVKKYGS